MRPIDWSWSVQSPLVVRSSPLSVSTSTMSVSVPPMSKPTSCGLVYAYILHWGDGGGTIDGGYSFSRNERYSPLVGFTFAMKFGSTS